MKIYFAGSIRGGRDDKDLYLQIIQHLGNYGQVLTEHIGLESLTNQGETNITDNWIFNRDVDWVHQSDILVAEVTTPSLGVGYEIGLAESLNKKIICLFRNQKDNTNHPPKRLSAMINGNQNLTLINYTDLKEAKDKLDEIFQNN